MTNEKIKVVVIVGPTASGKTSLGIKVAQAFDGEIVSADSMQIYKGMPIATAVPDETEKSMAAHHLIEFLEPSESFSVADYVTLAKKTVSDIAGRGKLPVIVGGTGLYVNSLIDNIVFTSQKSDSAIKQQLEQEFDLLGGQTMLCRLNEIDPETAARLHPNDRKRIIRALEVYLSSGVTITKQNELSLSEGSPFDPVIIGIEYSNREVLYDRINKRVDIMLQNGLLEEVKSCNQKGATASQAIGHKEFLKYLNGEVSLTEATEHLKRQTRRYAKRQLTWFRKDSRVHWIDACTQNVLSEAEKIIKEEIYHC